MVQGSRRRILWQGWESPPEFSTLSTEASSVSRIQMIGHHAPNKAREFSRGRGDGQRLGLMRGDRTELSFQPFIAFVGVSDDLGIIALLSFHKRGRSFSGQGAGEALSRLSEKPSNTCTAR